MACWAVGCVLLQDIVFRRGVCVLQRLMETQSIERHVQKEIPLTLFFIVTSHLYSFADVQRQNAISDSYTVPVRQLKKSTVSIAEFFI